MVRFIHAADFHLDTPFAALSPAQAAARRRESREMLLRLADYVIDRGIDLVLLAGDLLDGRSPYRETAQALRAALERMAVPVCIVPGNHDPYGEGSLWQRQDWPENVRIFRQARMTAEEFPQLGVTVHGAAFTAPEQAQSLLAGFSAPRDGAVHIGLLHGEVEAGTERYNSLRRREIADSGLAYLALGHIHKREEPKRYGATLCAWPGCMEGRGFDETGEKGFYEGEIADNGSVSLTFVPFARHRYEILEVDVTGRDPRAAVEAALPADTREDLYRILLTGETDGCGADPAALEAALGARFGALEVRDCTRMAEDVWKRAEEDSLRGLFLRELWGKYKTASTEEEREMITRAARFGLAALDGRDLG